MTTDKTNHNTPYDESLARNLNNLPDADVPEGLEDRVMATLFSDNTQHTEETLASNVTPLQRPPSSLKKVLPLVSIAASVLIVMTGYQLFNSPTTPSQQPQEVAQIPIEIPLDTSEVPLTTIKVDISLSSTSSDEAEKMIETILIASLSNPEKAFEADNADTYYDTYDNGEPDVISDFIGF